MEIPEDVQQHYELQTKVTSEGWAYVEICKGIFGLPQAGLLAQKLLEKQLAKNRYTQSKLTPGLWTHHMRPIQFCLLVDDFGVKHKGKEHAEHIHNILAESFKITTDWRGEKYIGFTLEWDYTKHEVHPSMPGYVQ